MDFLELTVIAKDDIGIQVWRVLVEIVAEPFEMDFILNNGIEKRMLVRFSAATGKNLSPVLLAF